MSPPDEPPSGLSDAAQERLIGLALIACGVLGFGVMFLLWRYAPAAVPAPPGLPQTLLPLLSPLTCMLPVSAIGAGLLVVVGLRKLILGS
jgi:hypothetical protein